MSLAHLAARATFAAFVAAVNVPASLDAQALPIPTDNPRLRAALDMIKAQEAWTVSQQISLCEIAAPPYKEAARAAEYRRRLQALGITRVHVDSVGNVTTGTHVHKGQQLMRIYGPNLSSAAAEYLSALNARPGVGISDQALKGARRRLERRGNVSSSHSTRAQRGKPLDSSRGRTRPRNQNAGQGRSVDRRANWVVARLD